MKLIKKKLTKKQKEFAHYLIDMLNCKLGRFCSKHQSHNIKITLKRLLED